MIDTFKPAPGLANRHLQTVAPSLFGRFIPECYTRQELTLPDGDFVDVDWTRRPDSGCNSPIVVLFHGLAGNSHSHYIRALMRALTELEWIGVAMNFRGCSGRCNRLPRSYHSGETGDAGFFISWLAEQFPSAPLMAVGFSLGGNMLLKLAGEQSNTLLLKALVAVSAPLKLDESTRYMTQGFSRFYQAYLLNAMKREFMVKFMDHDYQTLIGVGRQDVINCQGIREFDHLITARLHGFSSKEDYYQQCSAYSYIDKIEKPGLIIHAKDDPIAPSFMLPDISSLPSQVALELTAKGGHVGFFGGTMIKPRYWLVDRIIDYFKESLTHSSL